MPAESRELVGSPLALVRRSTGADCTDETVEELLELAWRSCGCGQPATQPENPTLRSAHTRSRPLYGGSNLGGSVDIGRRRHPPVQMARYSHARCPVFWAV
jgi:hypothetical protein